jgi:spore coat polysaccharide biosynthesis protein SpsF (cytidylyltransferase family)
MIPPLAILQARLHSTRMSSKMLWELNDKPLLRWAWETAVEAFGQENVVVAIPQADEVVLDSKLPGVIFFGWEGAEDDVLGRLYACAQQNRTDSETLVHRLTPDDFPVQLHRDVCSLAWLERMHDETTDPYLREHVGYLFHPEMPVEVNTPEDFAYLQRKLAHVK